MTRTAAFRVVADFEAALAEYTGAPYVVSCDSCTNAIFLALLWWREAWPYARRRKKWEQDLVDARAGGTDWKYLGKRFGASADWMRKSHRKALAKPPFADWVIIPKHTYVGVAQAIRNAGFKIGWSDEDWSGTYQIKPFPLIDAAKRFTSGMYVPGTLTCVSFQRGKILAVGRGGAILLDDPEAAAWLRRARFDGRTPGDDSAPITRPAFHMYMDPPTAAMGLWALTWLPKHNEDQTDNYDDLSQIPVFRS